MQPVATYRLQLHAGFTFADAIKAVPYLAELGVSHLYLSPILQAGPGSMHGYDVVDPERVSTDLGGEEGFRALVTAAKAVGLAILLDIVPNHMSIGSTGNRWWLDVLENGPASTVAHYFDVDWGAADDRIVLPVLGERYGRALLSGVLKLCRHQGTVQVCAHDRRFPLAPRSLGPIVRRAGERAGHAELRFLGDALAELPAPQERDRRERRQRDKSVLYSRLGELVREPVLDAALEAEITAINADPVALDVVLEAQNYRLAFWRVAASQLSFRRFFDITTLVGMRAEEPDVLEATHRAISQWLADGTVAGVRVDHVDGLRAPAAYLAWLRTRAPDAWIVVEKILAAGERMPASWAADGTTGYELIEWMTGLLTDPAAVEPLTATFETYTHSVFDPSTTGRAARLEVMSDALHSELERVTELAMKACAASAACRDFTRDEVRATLAEIFAGYPTYRTYFGEGPESEEDRERISLAVSRAADANGTLDTDLLTSLEAALSFQLLHPDAQHFAASVQQATGAILAKGDEDTTAYRSVRLLARCEVGSDVRVLATPPAVIHARLAANPVRSLLASSTHDTKRSEDVRARIVAISEVPAAWATATTRWRERAERHWGTVEPDRTFEYAAWQTFVGAWPLSEERAQQWAEKATREARQRTSWRRPDEGYEAARRAWIAAVYADRELQADLARFVALVTPAGDRNALAQLLVKLTAPGVPDIYQGTELRDDSLVDPDNRRPVDLAARAQTLRALADATVSSVASDLDRAKLFVIQRVLGVRRRDPARFAGGYRALVATGPEAERVFAFARLVGDSPVGITVVPRLAASADATLALPDGTWTNVLGGRAHRGSVHASALFGGFPVAYLIPG